MLKSHFICLRAVCDGKGQLNLQKPNRTDAFKFQSIDRRQTAASHCLTSTIPKGFALSARTPATSACPATTIPISATLGPAQCQLPVCAVTADAIVLQDRDIVVFEQLCPSEPRRGSWFSVALVGPYQHPDARSLAAPTGTFSDAPARRMAPTGRSTGTLQPERLVLPSTTVLGKHNHRHCQPRHRLHWPASGATFSSAVSVTFCEAGGLLEPHFLIDVAFRAAQTAVVPSLHGTELRPRRRPQRRAISLMEPPAPPATMTSSSTPAASAQRVAVTSFHTEC